MNHVTHVFNMLAARPPDEIAFIVISFALFANVGYDIWKHLPARWRSR